jgi:hypothetical protein
MSSLQSRASLLIAVVTLAGASADARAQAPTGTLPEPLAVNKPLAEEQLKLVRQTLKDLDLRYRNGELSIVDPSFDLWRRREVEAVRASGADKAATVAALEKYVKHLKDREQFLETLHGKDQVTRVDVADAKYRVLEGEMWLNREKAR